MVSATQGLVLNFIAHAGVTALVALKLNRVNRGEALNRRIKVGVPAAEVFYGGDESPVDELAELLACCFHVDLSFPRPAIDCTPVMQALFADTNRRVTCSRLGAGVFTFACITLVSIALPTPKST